MDLGLLVSTFRLVPLAELGDKTQLATLGLAVASAPGGSWGGRRPSRAGDVTVTGAMEAMDGAAAARGG